MRGMFAAALIVLWSGVAMAQDRGDEGGTPSPQTVRPTDLQPGADPAADRSGWTIVQPAARRSGWTSQDPAAERSDRTVVLEVLLIHMPEPAGRAADTDDAGGQGEAVLSRSARQTWDWATGRDAASAGARVRRVRLTGVENSPARVQVGKSAAVPSGRSRSFGGRGDFQTTYQQIDTGLIVEFTAKARGEKIAAEINVEESRLEPTAQPDPTDLDGDAVVPPAKRVTTAQGTVVLTPGEPVVLGGVESTNTGQGTTLILGRVNWAE